MNSKKIKQLEALNVFSLLNNSEKNVCFFHSSSKHKKSFLAFNPVDKLAIKVGTVHNKVKQFIEKNQRKQRFIFGYFSYDYGRMLQNVKRETINDLKLPEVHLLAFQDIMIFKNNNCTLKYKTKTFPKKVTEILKRELKKKLSINKIQFKPNITASEYKKAHQKIKSYIKKGDIYQINLTHRLESKTTADPRDLFTKIVRTNPVDHLAYIEGDGFEILSASPERFVKIKNNCIITSPIKGTRPRSKNSQKDKKNMKELLENEKEKAELNMITDLLRNDVGKIAEPGSVKLITRRAIQKCPTVWHTYSTIKAKIREDISPTEALISMLPGGSISGCPKKRAIEVIEELEKYSRGIYTGTIGYITPDQTLDFNIAIRTIIKKGSKLYLQVGGGIVLDSKEQSEYQETMDKAKSFMNLSE